VDRVFEPQMSQAKQKVKIAGWKKAVTRSFDWER
jgi:glycerol kinase